MNKSEQVKLNILNIAWVGQGDFGDEAMAYALRRYLMSHGVNLITYYQHGELPHHRDNNDLKVKTLYSYKSSRLKRAILDKFFLKKINAIIIGGGSIFHSYNSIQWKFDLLKSLKAVNKNLVFSAAVGISLGPFKSQKEEKFCGELIDNIDICILRDNYSTLLAKKISSNQYIYSSLDTSLLLPKLCVEEMQGTRDIKQESDLVGLIFVKEKRKEELFNKNHHLDKYLTILNHILEKNKRIVLFNFYLGEGYPDIELNNLLKQSAKFPERIEIYNYNGDIFQTVRQLNRCSHIVSMRLHGIIFSYMLGIPFLSLGYNPKNHYFCESIRYPTEMSFDFNTLDDINILLAAIDKLFNRNKELFNHSLSLKEATNKVMSNLNLLIERMNKKLQ